MSPRITILTPSLSPLDVMLSHYEWFLSLRSTEFELIIVDQNPVESELLAQKSLENEYFKYIHNDTSGLSKNRNIGAKIADGDYILFLDDDARFDDKMADTILLSINNCQFDIVLGAIVDKEGNPRERIYRVQQNL